MLRFYPCSAGTGWTATYWNFGSNTENPAPIYNDYDGSANMFPSCSSNNGGFPSTIPGTSTPLVCGTTLVGGSRPAIVPPGQVMGLSATSGSGQITLTWNAVTDATSYRVYRGTNRGTLSAITEPALATPGSPNLPDDSTATTFTDTGLASSTTYYRLHGRAGTVGADQPPDALCEQARSADQPLRSECSEGGRQYGNTEHREELGCSLGPRLGSYRQD